MKNTSMKKSLATLIFIILLVILIDRTSALKTTKNKLAESLSPLLSATFRITQTTRIFFSSFFVLSKTLETENASLKNKIVEYDLLKSKNQQLTTENDSLLSLLRYNSSALNKITAQIIGNGTDATLQSIIIDKGKLQGIKIGSPVIAEQGILIGTIWSVADNQSIVELITDNQSKIGAGILNKEQTIGIATGSHGLSVQIEMIPQNEVISVDDLVITSGIESSIPRGILIGKIASIKKESSEPFQTARLFLPLELNKLRWVAVLER